MQRFTGHIDDVEAFRATDDGEALDYAKTKKGLSTLELWCLQRKVARLETPDEITKDYGERFLQGMRLALGRPVNDDAQEFEKLLLAIDDGHRSLPEV